MSLLTIGLAWLALCALAGVSVAWIALVLVPDDPDDHTPAHSIDQADPERAVVDQHPPAPWLREVYVPRHALGVA